MASARPPGDPRGRKEQAYRAVSGEVTSRSIASSPALHMEVLSRSSPQPVIEWLYKQPVATLMWMRNGFGRYDLNVTGTVEPAQSARTAKMFYLPPGADARGEFVVEGDCNYIAIFFPAELAEHAASYPLIGFDDQAMRMGLTELSQWTDDPGFDVMAEGWTLQAAARLRSRSLEQVAQHDDLPEFNPGRLIEFLRYGGRVPSLAEMAQVAELSRSEMMRAVWRRTRQTPFEYALKVRMDAAADLLAHSRLSLDEIARRAGYESVSSFSRAFQRVRGRTPSFHRALPTGA